MLFFALLAILSKNILGFLGTWCIPNMNDHRSSLTDNTTDVIILNNAKKKNTSNLSGMYSNISALVRDTDLSFVFTTEDEGI